MIDLTSFKNVVNSLNEIIKLYNVDKTNLILRDCLLERFVFTYTQTITMIKRHLASNYDDIENVKELTFKDMIRVANIKGLLKGDVENWTKYKENRNISARTYNEVNAEKVATMIVNDFALEINFLLNKLIETNDKS
ncbi:MAG: nucleotidyltransferase substrate binding protein [Rickettsiales bacterium]|nr:MAG: nucleotidyltransferase substrate binding protein [Rickettsiales bacterium]